MAADRAAVDAQVLRSFTANPVSVCSRDRTLASTGWWKDPLTSSSRWTATTRHGPGCVSYRLPAGIRRCRSSPPRAQLVNARHVERRRQSVCGNRAHPAHCLRAGRVVFDYHRAREDFAFEGKKLTTPTSNGVLTFDACSTDPGRHGRIERYGLVLRQLGHLPERISRDVCRFPVRLGGGVWGGVLQARAADGVVLSAPVSVRVHDRFVVCLAIRWPVARGTRMCAVTTSGSRERRRIGSTAHVTARRSAVTSEPPRN